MVCGNTVKYLGERSFARVYTSGAVYADKCVGRMSAARQESLKSFACAIKSQRFSAVGEQTRAPLRYFRPHRHDDVFVLIASVGLQCSI